MNEEQVGELMRALAELKLEVQEDRKETKLLRAELQRLRGDFQRGRADITAMSAQVDSIDHKTDRALASSLLVLQQISGMNDFVKTTFDMTASNTKSIKKLKLVVGIKDDEDDDPIAAPVATKPIR